jgi:hypothetical protein
MKTQTPYGTHNPLVRVPSRTSWTPAWLTNGEKNHASTLQEVQNTDDLGGTTPAIRSVDETPQVGETSEVDAPIVRHLPDSGSQAGQVADPDEDFRTAGNLMFGYGRWYFPVANFTDKPVLDLSSPCKRIDHDQT